MTIHSKISKYPAVNSEPTRSYIPINLQRNHCSHWRLCKSLHRTIAWTHRLWKGYSLVLITRYQHAPYPCSLMHISPTCFHLKLNHNTALSLSQLICNISRVHNSSWYTVLPRLNLVTQHICAVSDLPPHYYPCHEQDHASGQEENLCTAKHLLAWCLEPIGYITPHWSSW